MNTHHINPPPGFRAALSRIFWMFPFGSVPEISCIVLNEILEKKNSTAQLLDVRTPSEWKEGHIQNSVNIPLSELRSRIPQKPFHPEKDITVICWATARSTPAVRLLRAWGFEKTRQLAGGMKEWGRKGLPIEKDS